MDIKKQQSQSQKVRKQISFTCQNVYLLTAITCREWEQSTEQPHTHTIEKRGERLPPLMSFQGKQGRIQTSTVTSWTVCYDFAHQLCPHSDGHRPVASEIESKQHWWMRPKGWPILAYYSWAFTDPEWTKTGPWDKSEYHPHNKTIFVYSVW